MVSAWATISSTICLQVCTSWMAPQPWPAGKQLCIGVAFGHFGKQEPEQTLGCHRFRLMREGFDVLRVPLPFFRRGVAQGSQGLSRPATGDHRITFARLHNRVLVDLRGSGLLRGDKPRADPDARAAEGEGRHQAATVKIPPAATTGIGTASTACGNRAKAPPSRCGPPLRSPGRRSSRSRPRPPCGHVSPWR